MPTRHSSPPCWEPTHSRSGPSSRWQPSRFDGDTPRCQRARRRALRSCAPALRRRSPGPTAAPVPGALSERRRLGRTGDAPMLTRNTTEDPMRKVMPAGAAFLGLLLLAGAARGQVGPEDFASLARVSLPAVVTITVPDVFDAGSSDEDSRSAEFLYELFGGPLKGRRQAVGAGVILDADGLVITSAHAVAGAADIEAIVADGVSRKATVVR